MFLGRVYPSQDIRAEDLIAVSSVRNSNHIRTAGYYALKFPEKNMLGLVLSNAPPTMAPWGGRVPLFGKNPLSWAVPSGVDYPVFLDIASSVVSRGRIKLAVIFSGETCETSLKWLKFPYLERALGKYLSREKFSSKSAKKE